MPQALEVARSFALETEVIEIALAAGQAILNVYEDYLSGAEEASNIQTKSDSSPLTMADLAAHQLISEQLRCLTPDIPVVSEEDAESIVFRKPTGRFWLVDPLDGTKEFIARNGEFTVNIALIEDGRPMWGVVYAPVLDRLYYGGRDFGAQLQVGGKSQELSVSACPDKGGLWRVVASKSHLNTETQAFIDRLGSRVDLLQAGSSLKLCRIAEGSADIYPRLGPTCEWDTAAAQAVVEGAGGVVHDLQGNSLQYGKPDVLNPSFIVAAHVYLADAHV